MRRFLLLPFVLLLAVEAKAGMHVALDLADNARAKVTVGCCFESLPPTGYAPIDVTINNFSGSTQEWTLQFSGVEQMNGGANISSRTKVTVENDATRTFPLLVPMAADPQGNFAMLRISLEGYGAGNGVGEIMGGGANSGHPDTHFVVISQRLGTSLWSSLQSLVTSDSKQLNGSLVDPAALPSDWRGLSGVHTIWLADGEVDQLSLAQRGALRTWLRMGGALKLCGAAAVPADFEPAGFGSVEIAPAKLDVNSLAKAICNLPSPPPETLLASLPLDLGGLDPVAPNVPGLIAFMALFGVVVGPVNIFLLAGSKRRQRLFWTTPLISVAASAGLIGFILLQDGVGGKGVRTAIVYVVPQEHSEIVVQQQTSRTGLLLGSSFQTRDPVLIQHVPLATQSAPMKTRALQNDGTLFSGDWFMSRSLQTQQIRTAVSTRGEITLANAAEARDQGAAPIILSSFAVPFDTLVYTDGQQRHWFGKDVRTGQKQTLVPGGTPALFPDSTAQGSALGKAPNTFVANTADSTAYVATLPAIRWQDQPVIYLGPVTAP